MQRTALLLPTFVLLLGSTAIAQEVDEALAAEGEGIFQQCQTCHKLESDDNALGPHLQGVIGRTAGSVEGYNYSPALKSAGEGGLTWTEEELDAFLEDPQGYINGTRMAYPGLPDADQRAAVIEYIKANGGMSDQG